MKTTLHEMDHGYFIEFTSETVEDAALLCRMAINHTKKAPDFVVYGGNSQFDGNLVIGRRKNSTSKIPRQ